MSCVCECVCVCGWVLCFGARRGVLVGLDWTGLDLEIRDVHAPLQPCPCGKAESVPAARPPLRAGDSPAMPSWAKSTCA